MGMTAKYPVIEGMKYCPMCAKYMPEDKFHKKKGNAILCKEHHYESSKPSQDAWRERHGQKIGIGKGGQHKLKPTEELKTEWYRRKREGIIQIRKDTKELEYIPLYDETALPIESPYQGCKMIDIPAWYLLKISGKCPKNVQKYINDNMEVLQLQNKK